MSERNPLDREQLLADLRALAKRGAPHPSGTDGANGLRTAESLEQLNKLIDSERYALRVRHVGVVQEVGDGIVIVSGLPEVMLDELLLFPTGVHGLALSLDEHEIGCVLLGPERGIDAGDLVERTGRVVEVPVGDALAGRVVNALGEPIIPSRQRHPMYSTASPYRSRCRRGSRPLTRSSRWGVGSAS